MNREIAKIYNHYGVEQRGLDQEPGKGFVPFSQDDSTCIKLVVPQSNLEAMQRALKNLCPV